MAVLDQNVTTSQPIPRQHWKEAYGSLKKLEIEKVEKCAVCANEPAPPLEGSLH